MLAACRIVSSRLQAPCTSNPLPLRRRLMCARHHSALGGLVRPAALHLKSQKAQLAPASAEPSRTTADSSEGSSQDDELARYVRRMEERTSRSSRYRQPSIMSTLWRKLDALLLSTMRGGFLNVLVVCCVLMCAHLLGLF